MKGLTRLFGLTLAAALAFAAGCSDNDRPITARGDTYGRPWLMLGSDDLRKDIVVGDAVPARDRESGILFITVPIRNVTDKQLYIDYKITFTDAGGMLINPITGNVTIPARQSVDVTGNATSNRADKFRVELSYPRLN